MLVWVGELKRGCPRIAHSHATPKDVRRRHSAFSGTHTPTHTHANILDFSMVIARIIAWGTPQWLGTNSAHFLWHTILHAA